MGTSPTRQKRPAPPPTSPTRDRDDTIAEGSAGKQQRTTAERQTLERPTTTEQPKGNIKFATRDGRQMETTSNEDAEEIENERILQEPITHATQGLDPQLMSHEERSATNERPSSLYRD